MVLAIGVMVLNLVISGIPSILNSYTLKNVRKIEVLNLVISGIPSILSMASSLFDLDAPLSFKPCYKWNTFNTYTRIYVKS